MHKYTGFNINITNRQILMCFLKIISKYVLNVTGLKWLGSLSHSLGVNNYLHTLLYWFLAASKVNKTEISVISQVYILLAEIQWCCSTQYLECVKQDLVQRCETCRKPIQQEQSWCFMFPFGSECDQTCNTVMHSLMAVCQRGGVI